MYYFKDYFSKVDYLLTLNVDIVPMYTSTTVHEKENTTKKF